jgi:hypothetical protein
MTVEKCFDIPDVPILKICVKYENEGISVAAKLGPVQISKVSLGKDGVCDQLGGGKDGFDLKIKACFHRNPDRIDLDGDVGTPKGHKTVRHTHNI